MCVFEKNWEKIVSWCVQPSQLQRITSGLKTNSTLSSSYSFHKSSYHKSCFWAYLYSLALNTATCIQQGDLYYSAGLHGNRVSATANTGEIGRGFAKNAGEWTGRVEISKEEWSGQKIERLIILAAVEIFKTIFYNLLQALKRWPSTALGSLQRVTFISASAVPYAVVRRMSGRLLEPTTT